MGVRTRSLLHAVGLCTRWGSLLLARAPFAYRWEETGCNFASVADTRPASSHFNVITCDSLISFWSLVQCHSTMIIGGYDTGGEVCDHVNFMVTGALNLLARFVTRATRLIGATSAQLAGPVQA
jgi:hypothetical protein